MRRGWRCPCRAQPVPAGSRQFCSSPTAWHSRAPRRSGWHLWESVFKTRAKRLPWSDGKKGEQQSCSTRRGRAAGWAAGSWLRPTHHSQRNPAIFDEEIVLCFIFLTAKRRGGATISLHIYSEQQFISSNSLEYYWPSFTTAMKRQQMLS